MRRAVQMRTKAHALFAHLAQLAQAEHLEAAGVGEQGALPAHELVQPAQIPYQLVSRSQIEVIGVSQDDLRAQVARTKVFQNVLRHRFNRSRRAARHKSRGFYIAVSGMYAGLSCRTGLGLNCERESHYSLCYKLCACLERTGPIARSLRG